MAIAATGAGLHVAAYYLEGESKLGRSGGAGHGGPGRRLRPVPGCPLRHARGARAGCLANGLSALAILAVAVGLAAAGLGVPWCLLVVMLAPVPTIVSDERAVARRREAALAALADD